MEEELAVYLDRIKKIVEIDLKDQEKELLKFYRERSSVPIIIGTTHSKYPGKHFTHSPMTWSLKLDQRYPEIKLGPERHIKEGTSYKKSGIRNVEDISHKDAFVLAHELGHDLDYQTNEALADKEDLKAIDRILMKMEGNQYDLRQAKKRNTPQLFADDLGRILLGKLQGKKQEKKYLQALDKYVDQIFK